VNPFKDLKHKLQSDSSLHTNEYLEERFEKIVHGVPDTQKKDADFMKNLVSNICVNVHMKYILV